MIHPHTFCHVAINLLASAGTFWLVALDFGAYLVPKCTADLRHHVVHRVNFISIDIDNDASVDLNRLY